MDASELVGPFARMLDAIVTPAAVRVIERGGGADAIWNGIAASGFLDALVSEDAGGAGLPLSIANALWQEVGRRAVSLPVGETMIARALLGAAGKAAPDGPIALVVATSGCPVIVPLGLVAKHILVESDGALHVVTATSGMPESTGVAGDLSAVLRWSAFDGEAFASPEGAVRNLAAVLRAALIAGAADRLVEMTAVYANERIQFGKPIGRQQALQQDMAVMAEEAVAARIASQLGCAGGFPPSQAAAATAKSVASRAAVRIAATAHAVHGATGISEEHDLHLYTRRLHQWRLADGAEPYWNRKLALLNLESEVGAVDFVREALG